MRTFAVLVAFAAAACSHNDMSVHTTAWDDSSSSSSSSSSAAAGGAEAQKLPPFITDPLPSSAAPPATFIDEAKLAAVLIQTKGAWRSGFVVAVQGSARIVVTNHHVVAKALEVGA